MMRMTRENTGTAYVGVLIGIAVTVLLAMISCYTWPDYLELKLLDIRHRYFTHVSSHSSFVHIDIDDKSIEKLGRWPWPRRYIAHLVDLCAEAGAKVIMLDIVMPDEGTIEYLPEGFAHVSRYEPKASMVGQGKPVAIDNDAILARAIIQAGNVAMPFHAPILHKDEQKNDAGDEIPYYYQIQKLFSDNPSLSFEDVFTQIWPEKDILEYDLERQELLSTYLRCRSIKSFTRFGLISETSVPIKPLGMPVAPFPLFVEAISSIGYATPYLDDDGVARRMPLLGSYDGKLYKQLAFAALCQLMDVRDEDIDLSGPGKLVISSMNVQIPLDKDGMMLMSWIKDWEKEENHIPALFAGQIWRGQLDIKENEQRLGMIENLSYQLSTVPENIESLDAQTQEQVKAMREQLSLLRDRQEILQANEGLRQHIEQTKTRLREIINGKIVLVGSTATSVPDFLISPTGSRTPGVVVHGNIINTIMQRSFIRRPSRIIEIFIMLLLGAVISIITARFRPLISGIGVVMLIGLTVTGNFVLAFQYWHYWLAIVGPLAIIVFTFTSVTFYRQVTEGKAKRLITARFKQYTSPAVVDQIVSSAHKIEDSFAGEIRPLSCFFSDLAGFTSVSERLGPQGTVAVLNIYLDRMTGVLDRYKATINKFEGDGIFAFFGAPIELPDHSRLACLAAIESQSELQKLVKDQCQIDEHFPRLKMRIGISTGSAVVGDCGSQRRFDYTAIGDTVNLGARLESANKAFGTQVMICETTAKNAHEHLETRYLGKVRVVGKKIAVGIYELLCPAGGVESSEQHYNGLFETAVRYYQDGRFDQAMQNFQRCLALRQEDKAALLYLKTTEQLADNPPPVDFDGCIELTAK